MAKRVGGRDILLGGVTILISKEYNNRFEYITGHKDNHGRFLLISCKKDNIPLIIINIYAPTKDKHTVQIGL